VRDAVGFWGGAAIVRVFRIRAVAFFFGFCFFGALGLRFTKAFMAAFASFRACFANRLACLNALRASLNFALAARALFRAASSRCLAAAARASRERGSEAAFRFDLAELFFIGRGAG